MYNSVYIYIILFTLKNLAIWLPISHWASLAFLESWTSPRYPPPTWTGKTRGKPTGPTCEGFLFGDIFLCTTYLLEYEVLYIRDFMCYNVFIHIYIYMMAASGLPVPPPWRVALAFYLLVGITNASFYDSQIRSSNQSSLEPTYDKTQVDIRLFNILYCTSKRKTQAQIHKEESSTA